MEVLDENTEFSLFKGNYKDARLTSNTAVLFFLILTLSSYCPAGWFIVCQQKFHKSKQLSSDLEVRLSQPVFAWSKSTM